jgi:hypothetical protein
MTGLRLRLALLAALALLMPGTARADERILSYASDIQVLADSSLEVTETIRVRAEGYQIKHGIYRDFPTTRGGSIWAPNRVGFAVVSVDRDGAAEPWTTEQVSGGIRVKIGDGDRNLDYGEHVYRIHYTTTHQIGSFEDFDELNWNVTGNGWIFPIDVAEARIRLPGQAAFGQRAVYTGPFGATGKNAEVVEERPGEIVFRTTAPLGPSEGLTVAVAWPKDVIAQPSGSAANAQQIATYAPIGLGALGLIGVLL